VIGDWEIEGIFTNSENLIGINTLSPAT